jgi:hypothetical protein
MVLWRKRLPQQRQLGSLASSAPFDDEREGDRQESTSRPKRRSSPFFVSFCHSFKYLCLLSLLVVEDTVNTLAVVLSLANSSTTQSLLEDIRADDLAMQLHAQVVAALLIALSTATASPAGAAASAPAPSRRPEPPREGVDWDSFGFSLNGVRTDFMYVATCTTNGVSEGEDPWLVPCGSSSGSSDDAAGEDGFSSNRYSGGGRIVPHAPIAMDPASTVLNYGQVLFEGLKAIRRPDGSIVVFRPESNAKRMADGARRLCMPPVSEELFVEAITQTVRANCAWVPPAGKGALYLRPLLLGSGGALGVGPSPEYTFLVYCSPVGGYFKKKKVGKSAGGTGAAGGLTEDEGVGGGRRRSCLRHQSGSS